MISRETLTGKLLEHLQEALDLSGIEYDVLALKRGLEILFDRSRKPKKMPTLPHQFIFRLFASRTAERFFVQVDHDGDNSKRIFKIEWDALALSAIEDPLVISAFVASTLYMSLMRRSISSSNLLNLTQQLLPLLRNERPPITSTHPSLVIRDIINQLYPADSPEKRSLLAALNNSSSDSQTSAVADSALSSKPSHTIKRLSKPMILTALGSLLVVVAGIIYWFSSKDQKEIKPGELPTSPVVEPNEMPKPNDPNALSTETTPDVSPPNVLKARKPSKTVGTTDAKVSPQPEPVKPELVKPEPVKPTPEVMPVPEVLPWTVLAEPVAKIDIATSLRTRTNFYLGPRIKASATDKTDIRRRLEKPIFPYPGEDGVVSFIPIEFTPSQVRGIRSAKKITVSFDLHRPGVEAIPPPVPPIAFGFSFQKSTLVYFLGASNNYRVSRQVQADGLALFSELGTLEDRGNRVQGELDPKLSKQDRLVHIRLEFSEDGGLQLYINDALFDDLDSSKAPLPLDLVGGAFTFMFATDRPHSQFQNLEIALSASNSASKIMLPTDAERLRKKMGFIHRTRVLKSTTADLEMRAQLLQKILLQPAIASVQPDADTFVTPITPSEDELKQILGAGNLFINQSFTAFLSSIEDGQTFRFGYHHGPSNQYFGYEFDHNTRLLSRLRLNSINGPEAVDMLDNAKAISIPVKGSPFLDATGRFPVQFSYSANQGFTLLLNGQPADLWKLEEPPLDLSKLGQRGAFDTLQSVITLPSGAFLDPFEINLQPEIATKGDVAKSLGQSDRSLVQASRTLSPGYQAIRFFNYEEGLPESLQFSQLDAGILNVIVFDEPKKLSAARKQLTSISELYPIVMIYLDPGKTNLTTVKMIDLLDQKNDIRLALAKRNSKPTQIKKILFMQKPGAQLSLVGGETIRDLESLLARKVLLFEMDTEAFLDSAEYREAQLLITTRLASGQRVLPGITQGSLPGTIQASAQFIEAFTAYWQASRQIRQAA